VDTQPLVSIITVNFNQLGLTCELLDSIRRNSYKNVEILVVDNASRENPKAYLNEHYPEVNIIVSDKNLGFAGGNNLAVRVAKGDFLFFINNDAELTNGCLEQLLTLFGIRPKLGIASPLLCYYNPKRGIEPDLIQYAGTTEINPFTGRNRTIGEKELDNGQFKTAQPTAYAHGAAMLIPKLVANDVGWMADDFFLYYEELDWCARIKQAGYECWVEPNARVYHKESVTVGAASPLKTYYINRNRIYFMRRNMRWFSRTVFTLFLIMFTIPKNLFRYVLKGEWKHARVFLQSVWWNLADAFSSQHPQDVGVNPSVVRNF
jgi:GT2 family glycosyltransferase